MPSLRKYAILLYYPVGTLPRTSQSSLLDPSHSQLHEVLVNVCLNL